MDRAKEDIERWRDGDLVVTKFTYTYQDGGIEEIISKERISDIARLGESLEDIINRN